LTFFHIGCVDHCICLGVAGLVMFGVAGLVSFGVTGLLGDGVANLFRNLPVLGMTLGKVVNGAVLIRNLSSDLVALLFRYIVSDGIGDGVAHLFGDGVAGLAGHNVHLGVALGSSLHGTNSHAMVGETSTISTIDGFGISISFSLDETAVAQTDDTKKN